MTPAFDAAVMSYTATTTNATNTITGTPTDSKSTVTVGVGGTDIDNGSATTWADGENVVTITVSNGTERRIYTVTVTKE